MEEEEEEGSSYDGDVFWIYALGLCGAQNTTKGCVKENSIVPPVLSSTNRGGG